MSASTPGATENRTWEKSLATTETRQAGPLQTLGGHQENGGAGYDYAVDCLLAAEGPVTVGDILAGHSSDTMIHLTTATEDELATATFPNFTPPHTTPGVFQGSSWVQLGDVSHMTLPEYQELVVGPSAAGYGSDVSAFVTHPPSSVFTPVNVPNLGGVQEFINGAVVKPGTYVPLPGKP